MKKRWMLAGAIAVVAGAAAPWVAGRLTEQHWQNATREFNQSQPFLVLETDRYDRGYLEASITGQLWAVDPETDERRAIAWVGHVSHGMTGSTIDFDVELQDGDRIEDLFPDEKPTMTVTSRVWGTSLVEFRMPAINHMNEATGESLNVSASYANVTVRDNGRAVELDGQWPGLVLRTPDLRLSLGNLELQQQANHLVDRLWVGGARMTLERLSLAPRGEPEVGLEGLTVTSETRADDTGQRFDVVTDVAVNSTRHGDVGFGPHQLEFRLQDVNVMAWNALLQSFDDMQAASMDNVAAGTDPQQVFEQQVAATMAMTANLEQLAARGLAMTMDWDLASPEGSVTGHIRVAHPESTNDDPVPLMLMGQTLEGQMTVSLPAALGQRYPQLGAELAPLLSQGVLVEEGDRYRMEATLKDAIVDLNGQPLPLPIPGGASASR